MLVHRDKEVGVFVRFSCAFGLTTITQQQHWHPLELEASNSKDTNEVMTRTP
jgi:hypothetical protein